MRWLIRFLIVLICMSMWPESGFSEDIPPPPTESETAADKIKEIVRLLQDPAVREWIDRKDREAGNRADVVAGQRSDPGTLFAYTRWEENARDRLHAVFSAVPRIPMEYSTALLSLFADATGDGYGAISLFLMLAVVLGLGAERHARRNWEHWGGSRHVLPIAVFVAAITPLFFALAMPPLSRLSLGSCLVAVVSYRLAAPAIEHATQQRFHWRLKVTLGVMLTGSVLTAVGKIVDLDAGVNQAVALLTSCVMLLLAVELAWSVSSGGPAKKTATSLLLLVIWLFWCLDLQFLFWSSVYAVALPHVLHTVTARLKGYLSSRMRIEDSDLRSILVVRGVRSLIVVLALVWIVHVWQSHPSSFGRDIPYVDVAIAGIVRSIFVLLIAELVWHALKAAIDRKLITGSRQGASKDQSEAGDERATRLHTLLPVLRNMLAVALLTVTALTVLAQLGFDIAPLVAGAGIFGVALGFGSQALVRDVISGIFYLFDDAFRIGEYIQAKDYKGTVEGFSLRSVKLRHHRGPLFTVPFGDLGAVENLSRDWSKVKLLITLPYSADLEKVRKIGKAIGQELLADAEFGRYFVEPLKMKGVEEFGQYGIVVSFSMVTLPTSKQGFIRRSAHAMLRKAFQENGITFAQPTIQLGGKEGGEAVPAIGELPAGPDRKSE